MVSDSRVIICRATIRIRATQESVMSQTVGERAADHITESAGHASRATRAVADAVNDGVGIARRAAKQSGEAAEEFLDGTARRVRRHPARTVAATFVVGFA